MRRSRTRRDAHLLTARRVTSVRTGRRRGYRVALAPGTYTVAADGQAFCEVPAARVRVARERFARLDVSIDTGIR